MRIILISIFLTTILTGTAVVHGRGEAPPPDFSSSNNFLRTCDTLSSNGAGLLTNQQRQAFAIFRDIELIKNIATFIVEFSRAGTQQPDAVVRKIVRDELTHVRDELRAGMMFLKRLLWIN